MQDVLSLKLGIDDMAGEWEGEVKRANAQAEAVEGLLSDAKDRMVKMAELMQRVDCKANEQRQGILELVKVRSFLGESHSVFAAQVIQ